MGDHVPPKIRGKKFFGQLIQEIFGHFSGKNHVKFGNLYIFQANIIKIVVF